jgi:hypothetical protein
LLVVGGLPATVTKLSTVRVLVISRVVLDFVSEEESVVVVRGDGSCSQIAHTISS